MIFYSGLGYLVIVLFVAPLVVIGGLLYKGFGIDVLAAQSWLPLHSLMVLGAVLVFVVGWLANRKMVEDITYEKSGPVTILKPWHTLYWVRMEYWGPIALIFYFVFAAIRYFK